MASQPWRAAFFNSTSCMERLEALRLRFDHRPESGRNPVKRLAGLKRLTIPSIHRVVAPSGNIGQCGFDKRLDVNIL